MKKRVSTAVAIVAAASLWVTLDRTDQTSLALAGATYEQSVTQTYINDASHWRFTVDGKRGDTLDVAAASRVTGQESTLMEGIHFSGTDDTGKAWTVTAGSGRWWQNVERLNLRDQVIVEGQSGTLTTPDLMIDIEQQTAVTGSALTLLTDNSTTTGYGLELDLKSGRMAILRNVETRYEP